MQTEELIKLAETGGGNAVEDDWLELLGGDSNPEDWVDRTAVLEALLGKGKTEEAHSLAVTAAEHLCERLEPADALAVCGAFLLTLKDNEQLRAMVGDLYRQAHSDLPGLDILMDHAGVEGGRPVRRALRTMDVCTALAEGALLVHRHEDVAARVESIDHKSWHVQITDGKRSSTMDAVELADNYEPAPDNDFRVLQQFEPEKLSSALQNDPAAIVIGIIQRHGNTLDSDTLESILCPKFVPAKDWSKWWTKARQGLRLSRHVSLEGRAPYLMKYDPQGASFKDEIEAKIKKAHDSMAELALIEEYVRGCKARREKIDSSVLTRAHDRIEKRARRMQTKSNRIDLTPWLAAHRIAELQGDPEAGKHLVEALKEMPDPADAIIQVEDQSFWPAACTALEAAAPDNLRDALERLLPHAPGAVAEHMAQKLDELGAPPEHFAAIAERILKEPVENSEGLAWLWNGPKVKAAADAASPITVFTRMLYAFGEVKRRDDLSRETIKRVVGNLRDVLRARDYDRFRVMMEDTDSNMALTFRTQIRRLDNLGRAAEEDLVKIIDAKYPNLLARAERPRWLQENVLYVTAEGKQKKQAEIDELVNVKMRENAIAIGNAAAHGDLSENSEYKFALEERDLLRARLAQMQKEMEIAQVMTADEVPTAHVGIGAHVVLEHVDNGARQEITILSPWEANIDRRIYNYLTPLAKSVLGTKLNDTVNVEFFDPPGEYRVVEIKSFWDN